MQVQIVQVSYLNGLLLAEEKTFLLFPAIKLITMQMLLTKRHDKAEMKGLSSVEEDTNNLLCDQL